MKFPEAHDFAYDSDFQHWFACIENEWIDILIPSHDSTELPEQKIQFIKFAEPVISELTEFGFKYIEYFSKVDLKNGGLNSIRYNELNGIAYIELQYVFENDQYYLWSVGFEKNPLHGFLLDVKSQQLDYGYSAIILHREPI